MLPRKVIVKMVNNNLFQLFFKSVKFRCPQKVIVKLIIPPPPQKVIVEILFLLK